MPTNRERDPALASSSSLMASITDALSQSHRGFTLEEATSLEHPGLDEPVPKYEPLANDVGRSAKSESHGPVTNGHVSSPPLTEEREGTRRATRRSTSPPCLPPGAAPAAVRAWDDRMGQGENGAHSDRPASSSADVPSQRLTSSLERDGEELEGLPYDRDSRYLGEEGEVGGDGKHLEEDTLFAESGEEAGVDAITTTYDEQGMVSIQRSVSTGAVSNVGGTSLARAGSQWRIPRVPPPSVDPDTNDVHQPSTHERQSLYGIGTGAQEDEELRTDESADELARHAAAAREVARATDALAFSAVAPQLTAAGYATPRAPLPGYELASPAQSQYPPSSSPPQPSSLGRTPQSSVPSSPVLPPNPPSANRGRGGAPPTIEAQPQLWHHHHTSSESIPERLPTPTFVPAITTTAAGGGSADSPPSPGPTFPIFRPSPPEYPRPTPPFSSPLMERSTSSLNSGGGASPSSGPRTISAAAFRRQQARSPSGTVTESGPADTSPLTLRRPSASPSLSPSVPRYAQMGPGSGLASPVPVPAARDLPRARLSVVNPDLRASDERGGEGQEFDYIGAHGGESAGYGAGRYVSDLEK
ncbi:hypothetical protein HD554DRAFT_1138342 [Boletus coccyginus]|nr:hypothetical protein HD554DRAFT_1138342 [Boletus coccyginus]